MNCREARNDIALWIGQDLDDPARVEEVRRHVASCPECRVHYRRLKLAMSALEHADVPATYEVRASLWPELSSRLVGSRMERHPQRGRWLPVVSFVAACAVLVAVVRFDQPPVRQQSGVPQPPIARGTFPDFSDLAARSSHNGGSPGERNRSARVEQKKTSAD